MSPLFDQTYAQVPDALRASLLRFVTRIATEPTIGSCPPRALVVGGFVRDLLRGVVSTDLDIEVYGVEAERLLQIANELFPECVHEVGRQFGILYIPLAEGGTVDLALPRRESKMGDGHRGFAITSDPFLPLTESVRRRDFTINALFWDPLTNELIDLVEGQKDLEQKIIRVVDATHFEEDPLRVYRAIQFVSRFAFEIPPETEAILKNMVATGELDTLSHERITEELKKLFLYSERPSVGFEWLKRLGIIERSYPELQTLIGTPQEPEWHPEGDVWIHTMLCIDKAAELIRATQPAFTQEERLQILVGTLCHDLGKPPTTQVMEKKGIKRIRSLGHQEAGEEPTRSLCARWSFSGAVIHAARIITLNHLRPGEMAIKEQKGELAEEAYANAIRKLLKRIYPFSWRAFLVSAEADYRGRTIPEVQVGPYPHGDRFRELVEKYTLDEEAKTPLMQGHDLIETFDLKPGKQIGELLRAVENERDEGKIKTKEEAIAYIKNVLTH